MIIFILMEDTSLTTISISLDNKIKIKCILHTEEYYYILVILFYIVSLRIFLSKSSLTLCA